MNRAGWGRGMASNLKRLKTCARYSHGIGYLIFFAPDGNDKDIFKIRTSCETIEKIRTLWVYELPRSCDVLRF